MRVMLIHNNHSVGYLNMQKRGLYAEFYGETDITELSRIIGVFRGGECSLGIPVPEGNKMILRTSVPYSKLPKGELTGARLMLQGNGWKRFPGGQVNGISFPPGERKDDLIRFPWTINQTIPVDEIILFCSYEESDRKSYLILNLNDLKKEKTHCR